MVTASFKEGQKAATTTSLQKYDYGEVLRIKGLSLPRYVAVQFAVDGMSEALPSSIGETVEGVTDVLIPNSLLRSNINPWNYNIMAYVYIVSGSSGKTEYTITIPVKWRPKTGDDQAADDDVAAVIGATVEKINTATQKAEAAANQAAETAAEISVDREQITQNATEISSLKGDLARIANTTIGVNLFNKDSSDNVYHAGIDADGRIISVSEWNTNVSHKIPISDASVPLRVTVTSNISIYCYSASDALLGSLNNIVSSNPATLIENTKYVRVIFYESLAASLMVYLSDTVLQYEPYRETTTIVADIDTDSTLTLGGKAADAKKVGKITSDLKEKIDYYSGFLQIKIGDNMMNPEKLLSNKDIDINGNVVDTTSDKSVTELIAVDPSIQLRVTTGFNVNLCQYDEEENKISFLYDLNSANPIILRESAKYVRLSIWNSTLPFMLYQSDTPKDYAMYKEPYSETVRRIVNIYNSDSEEEIFLKLYNAVKAENCDVYWEHGTYEFSTIFELMKTKYGFGSAFELPVGGGCRYYFNGSTLRAFAVSSDSNVIGNQSLIGSNRKTGSYELYDAIFEATGTVYVVHDEASSSPVSYTRKYKNIRMHYITDSSKRSYGMCLGGGAGLKANVEFDGCTFITESDLSSYDGGYHGGTSDVDFYLTIKNCYFSKRFQSDALNDGDVGHMVFCGNSVPHTGAIPTQSEWNIIAWGNEIRSKLTT